jgi:hypothetical protein
MMYVYFVLDLVIVSGDYFLSIKLFGLHSCHEVLANDPTLTSTDRSICYWSTAFATAALGVAVCA